MSKKFIGSLAFVLILSFVVTSQAGVLLWDDFNTPLDYKAIASGSGLLPGTPWDGFVLRCGAAWAKTRIVHWEANGAPNRCMYIRTTDQSWTGYTGTSPGWMMYKNVVGDFTATVHLTSFTGPGWVYGNTYVNYNNAGLMVRKPAPTPAMPLPLNYRDGTCRKENWFSNDYFPPWDINGNELRYCENGYRTDIQDPNRKNQSGNSLHWNAGRWLKLKCVKDTLSAYWSYDGVSWNALSLADPAMFYRPDIKDGNGMRQVGLFQCQYGAASAWAEFDNFRLLARLTGQAWYPDPNVDAENVDTDVVLKWDKWDATITSHNIYFSETFSDVNTGQASVKHVRYTNSYDPCGPSSNPRLKIATEYYWRVDEVNSSHTYAGDVWNFTTDRGVALNPNPSDNSVGVDEITTTTVQWTPYKAALAASGGQVLYISTDFNDVNEEKPAAGPHNLLGTANSYPVTLLKNTMYFWKVNTDCGTLGFAKGDVWNFTTVFEAPACDDFDTAGWDYIQDYSFTGTLWDGLVGEEFVSELNTDHCAGCLYMKTSSCSWGGANTGVLLYKEIVGPFVATVEVKMYPGLDGTPSAALAWCAIMARISDVTLGGPGEDWIAVAYCPVYALFGNRGDLNGWYTNTNEQFFGENGLGYNAGRFLQMNYVGNGKFYLRISLDGTTWQLLNPLDQPTVAGNQIKVNPTVMDQWDGIPLQVGLAACTFNSGAEAEFAFDNFCIGRIPTPFGYGPSPSSGGGMNPMIQNLSWNSGDFANYEELYFGTTSNAVTIAGHGNPEYKGTTNPGGPVYNPNIIGIDPGVLPAYKKYSYAIGDYVALQMGQTYYWRVDQVQASPPQTWTGTIWNFTLLNYAVIDNFERFASSGSQDEQSPLFNPPANNTLRKTWIDGRFDVVWPGQPDPPNDGTSGSYVQVNVDPCDGKTTELPFSDSNNFANGGSKSMKFYYDNGGDVNWMNSLQLVNAGRDLYWHYAAPKYSEAVAAITDGNQLDPDNQKSLELKSNWHAYKILKLSYYGNWQNAKQPMYVGLRDKAGHEVTIIHPDPNVVLLVGWHDWSIKLSAFYATNHLFDQNNVARIYIGFGNRGSPVTGGKGAVFFDDIRLETESVCIQNSVPGDFGSRTSNVSDCKVDANDLMKLTEVWLGSVPTTPLPIIRLTAEANMTSPVTTWYNRGTAGGKFDVNTIDTYCRPSIVTIEGKKAVWFDLNDYMVWRDTKKNDKTAPTAITGKPTYTVIYDVWTLSVPDEQCVISWARRHDDGNDLSGTCASFNYGSSASYGAATHWDQPNDIGFDRGVPAAHTWHTIADSYKTNDPNITNGTETVVVDGIRSTRENNRTLVIRSGDPVVLGTYNIPITSEPNKIVPDMGRTYKGAIAKIEVYDYAMTAGQMAMVMGSSIDMKKDNVIDFKDLALFAKQWLVGPILWP